MFEIESKETTRERESVTGSGCTIQTPRWQCIKPQSQEERVEPKYCNHRTRARPSGWINVPFNVSRISTLRPWVCYAPVAESSSSRTGTRGRFLNGVLLRIMEDISGRTAHSACACVSRKNRSNAFGDIAYSIRRT